MASLRERIKSARAAWTGSPGQPGGSPVVVDATPGNDADTEPSIVLPLGGRSHFEKQRRLIDTFDEDYADRWDKAKLLAAKIVALVLPIVAVLAIGGELGRYFAQFSGGAFSANLIAYSGEAAMAALTYILGSIVGRTEKSVSYYIKFGITLVIWLLFIAASAWGQWAVASSALPAGASTGLVVAIWLRIGMACMLDGASVAIMFWRGKSLSKFLAQQSQKADATIRVNESELTIQRAQASAAARQREDDLYLQGKERAQEVVNRVQELQSQALIEAAQQALLGNGQTGRGRQLRGGGSEW